MEVRRSGALLARRTRTIRMCSFDARTEGRPRPLHLVDVWSRGGIGLDRAGGARLSRKECSQYSECPHFLSHFLSGRVLGRIPRTATSRCDG